MGIEPEDKKALVIARRSRKNLDYIYAQKEQKADVEEFTQLLNSMLGMLVCLREEYFKGKEPVTWEMIEKDGLTPIAIHEDTKTDISPNLKPSKSFSKLISNLRHAFAHNCFDLIGNPITGIKVWNNPPDRNELVNKTWQANLTEKQLKMIAYLFVDFLEKKHGAAVAKDET